MTTRALTVVAEIVDDDDCRRELRSRLAAIRDGVTTNPVLRPADLPATHFTRWLILGDPHPDPHPDVLVWESNHDGETLDYLEAVIAAVPAGIDALFGCCVGYPRAGAAAAPDEVARWLHAHAVRAQAFYAAYRGLSRRRVVADGEVRVALGELLDDERAALVGDPPRAIHGRLRDRLVRTRPELDTSDDGDGVIAMWVKRGLAAIGLTVVGLALLPLWVTIFLLVRRAELRDRDAIRIDRPVHDEAGHHQVEDRVMQNQLTHVVDIKPGALRLATVWVVLTVVDVLARYFYVNGSLQGMTTIHFARWAILYDTRPAPAVRRHRLVFFSNYDGSWDAYLGEFIDRGSPGLTAIWSNTEGFPETYWLFGKGSRDEEAFKQWARLRQRPSLPAEAQAWWSGIPSSTVANVRDGRWVRRRVGRSLDDEEAAAWLRRV